MCFDSRHGVIKWVGNIPPTCTLVDGISNRTALHLGRVEAGLEQVDFGALTLH